MTMEGLSPLSKGIVRSKEESYVPVRALAEGHTSGGSQVHPPSVERV